MFIHVINAIHFWWFLLITTFIFIMLSYVAARVSGHFSPEIASQEHRTIANNLIGILSGGFSVLLAFVIINTWNYRLQTRASVAKEADYLAIISRDSSIFSQPFATQLKQAVGRYVVAVRTHEWQQMRQGKESAKAWVSLEVLYSIVQNYVPKTPHESFYYEQIISNLDALLVARRERLNQLESVIPTQLRQAIIIGAFLLAIILGAMRCERSILHNLPVLLFSGILGFNLALALSFDYPFSGSISIDNHLFYKGTLGIYSDANG